jgi:hypothetical protein
MGLYEFFRSTFCDFCPGIIHDRGQSSTLYAVDFYTEQICASARRETKDKWTLAEEFYLIGRAQAYS